MSHNECCNDENSCQTTTAPSECSQTKSESCCPIEKATQMWKSAFLQALYQAKVEVLKGKIQKAWGPKLDKSADAVLEAMELDWQSKLTQGKAGLDLKERLTKIMTEGKK